MFHEYVAGNDTKIINSDQMGVKREITYFFLEINYVIKLIEGRLLKTVGDVPLLSRTDVFQRLWWWLPNTLVRSKGGNVRNQDYAEADHS